MKLLFTCIIWVFFILNACDHLRRVDHCHIVQFCHIVTVLSYCKFCNTPIHSSQFKGFGTGFARRGDQKALTWEDDPPGKFNFYNLQYNTILDTLHVSLSYTNEKSGYFMPTSYLYTQALFFLTKLSFLLHVFTTKYFDDKSRPFSKLL